MQRALAEAVLKTFEDTACEQHAIDLSRFSARSWEGSYRWLDANGMALYFLERIKELHLEAVLPRAVLIRFEQNMADNRARTIDSFKEFARIQQAFADVGMSHIHVKGFATDRKACPDLSLRLQVDLDFLAPMRDAEKCHEILKGFGYLLTAKSGQVWEFKTGAATMPLHADLYKVKPQREVDMHFVADGEEMPPREWCERYGVRFPVLSETERFLRQAEHVLHHLRGEWVRLSWLLEFWRSVEARRGDNAFWDDVRGRAARKAELRTAIGASITMATIAFGEFAPAGLKSWTVGTLDRRMRLWIDRYGRKVITANFPGTKLYLLQPPVPVREGMVVRTRMGLLLPLRRPPLIVHETGLEDWRARLLGWRMQAGFVMFRLRFHVTEGWRYLLEAPRWKKVVGTAQ